MKWLQGHINNRRTRGYRILPTCGQYAKHEVKDAKKNQNVMSAAIEQLTELSDYATQISGGRISGSTLYLVVPNASTRYIVGKLVRLYENELIANLNGINTIRMVAK